jgi:hypothetical protein
MTTVTTKLPSPSLVTEPPAPAPMKSLLSALRAERPAERKPVLPPAPLRLPRRPRPQAITFAPLAWLKLRHFLHSDHVEIGGFGISSENDLLYVERFQTVQQTVSVATVEFDDAAVADYFDDCADREIPPSRCGRIWIHTHPGDSPLPSATDEETFARVFGQSDWAAMVIVARGGDTYARLRFSAGPGGAVVVPVRVDWERFSQDLLEAEGQLEELISAWFDEYGGNVHTRISPLWAVEAAKKTSRTRRSSHINAFDDLDAWYDQTMLADRLDAWDWPDDAAREGVGA